MARVPRPLLALAILGLILSACALPGSGPAATSTPPTTATRTGPAAPPTAPGAASSPTAVPAVPAAPATATASTPGEEPLYLSIIWHQHQPVYYKDPASGVYSKPWVRLHAAKDYLDMAAMMERYQKVHVTFNITPSLIKQLDDLAGGAKDIYQVMTEKPAAQLTQADKEFILRQFFDTNRKVIARFPRYQELLTKRTDSTSTEAISAALASFTAQDYLDLQVLFNLAWTDPDELLQSPLKGLIDKGRSFSEADKKTVLDDHLRIIKEVLPEHAKLQKMGAIEVTMTPYTHPILPLLIDSNVAKTALKDAVLPRRFSFPRDAVAQTQKGVQLYKDRFGADPRGMWPAEGSVAQNMVIIPADLGIKWMASDEDVLARSLGFTSFTRTGQEVVEKAGQLYRPYLVQYPGHPAVAMVFRDKTISDKVGFTYSGMKGEAAADDFIVRLRAIKAKLKAEGGKGPNLVSVILDGENAWENYENDGKDFLNALYQRLSDATDIKTVTPSEYLAKYPATEKIADLWPGSWIDGTYSTWIGEEEENKAWDLLNTARTVADDYFLGQKPLDAASLDKAREAIYAAEGSDWFWWYGDDQNSGDDASFDLGFRNTLMDVYRALKLDVPDSLYVPVIPRAAATPRNPASGPVTPVIDGKTGPDEWTKAAAYKEPAGSALSTIQAGYDAANLYFSVASERPLADQGDVLSIYLSAPRQTGANAFSRFGRPGTVLGFDAIWEVALDLKTGKAVLSRAKGDSTWEKKADLTGAALGGTVAEFAIPFSAIGELESGDALNAAVVLSKAGKDVVLAPQAGPVRVVVPDLGTTQMVLTIKDAKGDDHGPGSYTYPTDSAFSAGAFDIEEATVGVEAASYVFRTKVYGPIKADAYPGASAPAGFAIQAVSIYIDVDHKAGSGIRLLYPGSNAAVSTADAWDYALDLKGWGSVLHKAGADGKPERVDTALKVIGDAAQRTITARVPKAAIPGDPKTWGVLVVMLGQEGFPSSGVWGFRDVNVDAAQWRFGGAADDTNHTRIIDVAWAGTPSQEDMLKAYKPSKESNLDKFAVDDLAQLKMVRAQ